MNKAAPVGGHHAGQICFERSTGKELKTLIKWRDAARRVIRTMTSRSVRPAGWLVSTRKIFRRACQPDWAGFRKEMQERSPASAAGSDVAGSECYWNAK